MPTLLDALELCKNGLLELRVLPELDLVTLLMEQIQDHDVREVWQAVGEAGLEMLAEMQHSWREEWAELIQPLNCLASGTYKEEELAPWARMAAEIYQKMDDAQQQHVAGCDSMCQESLEALVLLHSFSSQSSEARNTATTFLAAMRDRSACQLQHEVSGLADGKDLGITASDVDVALVEVKAGLKSSQSVLGRCRNRMWPVRPWQPSWHMKTPPCAVQRPWPCRMPRRMTQPQRSPGRWWEKSQGRQGHQHRRGSCNSWKTTWSSVS